jgi:hypothetical protein
MGGTNDESNLIELTVEQHAQEHKKLFDEHGLWQDKIAWKALSGQIGKEDIIKEVQKLTHLGKKRPKEWCDNIGKSKRGVKQSLETIEKRRLKLIGQTREFTNEWKENISKSKKGQIPWIKGKKHSEKSKEKNKIAHLGNTYNKGRVHTEQSRKNMSDAHKGLIPYNKGMKYETVKCTKCNKEGGSNLMKRYHFENCKVQK